MSEVRISERVVAKVGDITRESVDAIVNAANSAAGYGSHGLEKGSDTFFRGEEKGI